MRSPQILLVAVLASRLALAQAADAPIQPTLQPASAHLLDASLSSSLKKAVLESAISAVAISIGTLLLVNSVLSYVSVNNSQPVELQQAFSNRGLGFGIAGAASLAVGLRLVQLALDKVDAVSTN